MIKRIIQFFIRGVWAKNINELPKYQQYIFKQIRVVSLAIRGFKEDDCLMRSSALTYYTVLSIVPIFAMVFGIAKGFGLEEKLNEILTSQLVGQEEILNNVLSFSNNLLNNTKGGVVAGVGVALLLWSVIKVMTNIELSFNAIWGIKKERGFVRKFTEYLAFIILAPNMVVLGMSATIFLSAYVRQIGGVLGFEDWFDQGVSFSLRILPYVMMWLLFALLYVIMPNTKVKFKSAIPAAIIAGSVYQLTEWAYFNFQIGAVKYNAIYGSFAALPLFLVWLQASWMIVLFGGELAFANQNQDQYEYEAEVDNASFLYKKKTALVIAHHIIKLFIEGKEPPSMDDLCEELKIPFRLVSHNIFELHKANIVSEVHSEGKDVKYQPALDTSKLTIQYVLEALERSGENKLPEPNSVAFNTIDNSVNEFYKKLHGLPENQLLRNI